MYSCATENEMTDSRFLQTALWMGLKRHSGGQKSRFEGRHQDAFPQCWHKENVRLGLFECHSQLQSFRSREREKRRKTLFESVLSVLCEFASVFSGF